MKNKFNKIHNEYNFYYDESEHSRKINRTTFEASDYYDNFVVAIVGWEVNNGSRIEKNYAAFEEKYIERRIRL